MLRIARLLVLTICFTATAASAAELEVQVEKLRNVKGVVHFCLTREPRFFPDCGSDPRAIKRSVAAKDAKVVRFDALVPANYALSVFHDENGNKKLDTFIAIPREGFGFSRNPTIRFGPPQFDQVRFDIGEGFTLQRVRMQYLL